MNFEDLDFPFDDFESYINSHSIKPDSILHPNWTIDQWMSYFKRIKLQGDKLDKRLVVRPIYYYGDAIIAFQIEEINIREGNSLRYYFEIIY